MSTSITPGMKRAVKTLASFMASESVCVAVLWDGHQIKGMPVLVSRTLATLTVLQEGEPIDNRSIALRDIKFVCRPDRAPNPVDSIIRGQEAR